MTDVRKTAAKGRERETGGTSAPPKPRTVFSLSEQETLDFGCSFAQQLTGGELIVLQGDLGLGKTVFARGVATGLEIPAQDVSSPSYTLVNEYRGGRLPLFHIDLYRLDEPEDIATLGIEELLSTQCVVLVEWGERLPEYYRQDAITVRLHDIGEGSRRIEILPASEASPTRRGDA